MPHIHIQFAPKEQALASALTFKRIISTIQWQAVRACKALSAGPEQTQKLTKKYRGRYAYSDAVEMIRVGGC